MSGSILCSPTSNPRQVRTADGKVLTAPPDWALLAPGDAGLTRRVKAAGPSWQVQEKRGRKIFSRGLWASQADIENARADLEAERATPQYAKKMASAAARRDRAQSEYVLDFANSVLDFLRFGPSHLDLAKRMAVMVSEHATPVGSGTVARTERIPVAARAEAAVVAWMRHQTTAYDHMDIPRIKGARREVRRELAEISRALLDLHRREAPHAIAGCPLCKALARPQNPSAA